MTNLFSPKAIFFYEKHSDYLEAYSSLVSHIGSLDVVLVVGGRNDYKSLEAFLSILSEIKDIKIHSFESKHSAWEKLSSLVKDLNSNDLLIAPFIRYRSVWKSLSIARSRRVKTVHLSESLPDSFGIIGYRLGYCNSKNSRYYPLSGFPMVIYAMLNKPDICYFPCMPFVKNPFTKDSLEPLKPPLIPFKEKILNQVLGDTPRPQVVAGFGYDPYKMASAQGWEKYVATSKSREIIVDGICHSLPIFVTAEDVLLFRKPTAMASYTSTTVVWAIRWYPDLNIFCYQTTGLERQYGFLFTKLATRTLKKMGIQVLPENSHVVNSTDM